MNDRRLVVAALGITQTLAWASSFYLPSVLAQIMGPDLGLTPAWIFGALSFGLGVSALLAVQVGHLIDKRGGRDVLSASNVLFALGLTLLAAARGPFSLLVSWLVLGVAMASGLYEPAFAALTRRRGHDSRGPITGVTLIAGFASTVGWPLSAQFQHAFGWRGACLAWAALHLTVALPLNAWALRGPLPPAETLRRVAKSSPHLPRDRRMAWLGVMFTASGIVSIGVATNMPGLLLATGVSSTTAIAAASLMGPAQVIARVFEYGARRWIDPLTSARIANSMHPIGAAILAIFGPAAVAPFAAIHGAGNGILTIAKGTLPVAMFGAAGYGARIGKLAAPARVGQAVAPFVLGLALERFGVRTLLISSGLSLIALLSLFVRAISMRAEVRTANEQQ